MQNTKGYDPVIERVIQEYSDMVYKLAYARTKNKHDAEDVFQEVFLRYVRRRPEFQSAEHEKAWILRVTINCSKNLFASFVKNRNVTFIENTIGISQEERILGEYLAQLPVKYLTIIHLFYYEDMKILDIAKLLNLKESTVKMQLTRARRLLKESIEMEEQNV